MADTDDADAEAEALQRLHNLTVSDLLEMAQSSLLRRLTAKALTGTINAQEMGVLRNLLRDNGMIFTGTPGQAPAPPPVDLPELSDPDYDN